MDYKLLSAQQQQQIAAQRYLEIEAEHYRLSLDLRLAASTGIENDNVVAARGQLDILVAQLAALTTWMGVATEPSDGELVSANGEGS